MEKDFKEYFQETLREQPGSREQAIQKIT